MTQKLNEYITTGAGTEGSLLIPKKIYGYVIRAQQKAVIPTSLAAIYLGPNEIPGSSVDINLADANSMTVFKVAEGAPVPLSAQTYSSFNMKPDKYGVRLNITKEMVEDSQFNLIELNAEQAGLEVAYNQNSLMVSDALDNATNTVSGGSAITIANITRAIQYLEDADYKPSDILVGPEVANDLRNIDTFVEVSKLGTRDAFTNGLIGQIYGMSVWVISKNAGFTTTTAYVIDRTKAFVMAEKRPVTLANYDDQTHDLSGSVLTQRIKFRQLRADAIAKITTT